MQEAKVENSLCLLQAEHGSEGSAAATAKRNLNYILLFHYHAMFPILFFVILNNYIQCISRQAGLWTRRFHYQLFPSFFFSQCSYIVWSYSCPCTFDEFL